MAANREAFSSRLGFIFAASGSAVGLGNVWGFPTEAASNGGGAFLLMYLLLVFGLAYPVLMAELIIGRYAKSNMVAALPRLSSHTLARRFGAGVGFIGIVTAGAILAFYSIVAGWMLAYALSSVLDLVHFSELSAALTQFSLPRNLVFTLLFLILTVYVVSAGVKNGIEKWSVRMMPALMLIMLCLIVYVLSLDGAMAGLKHYLIPDFSRVLDANLLISALGQSFFSLSLGVGTMLIYGSYIRSNQNLVGLGQAVTLIDVGIAVFAGLLILPAIYVAQQNGVPIYDEAGKLLSEDTLIFTVLPALFDTMGVAGPLISLAFFVLMSIAALTSSISMLEAPVAYVIERHKKSRALAAVMVGAIIGGLAVLIVVNFSSLFGLVISLTTQYSQPLIGLCICIYVAWLWNRQSILQEIKQGNTNVEHGFFWKVWPLYIRFVCPVMIALIFFHQFIS